MINHPALPPLSGNLRVFTFLVTLTRGLLSPSVSVHEAHCSSEYGPLAVLWPESFRGGCSFGAGVTPNLSRISGDALTSGIVRRSQVKSRSVIDI